MIKGPGSSSSVDETDTPLVLGKEKTGIPSPTPSRGANGLGGLPVSLAVAIEVSFGLPSAAAARAGSPSTRLLSAGPRQLMLLGHRQHHSEARLGAHHPRVSLCGARKRHCLDHRTHTRERAELEGVLRVDRRTAGVTNNA